MTEEESAMIRETLNFIRKYHMTDPGDRVVIGLSGGADSVCLLHLLWCLREELGIALFAVHVHHGLREAEADRDAAFAEEICRKLAVPCRVFRIRAKEEAQRAKISVEEAGRLARYRSFEEEADRLAGRQSFEEEADRLAGSRSFEEEAGSPAGSQSFEEARFGAAGGEESGGARAGSGVKIATAHHGNDSAETILFHLFRGSGLKGLSGIAPVRGNIIRPLLWAGRAEIRAYLAENGLPFVEDSTNADNEFTRNRIRNLILPAAEAVNGQAVQNILRAGGWIAGADRYLEKAAARWLEENRQTAGGETEEDRCPAKSVLSPSALRLPAAALAAEEPVFQGYVLRLALKRLGSPSKDITAAHIGDILSLLHKQTGKRVNLPCGVTAGREYGWLWLSRKQGRPGAEAPGGGAGASLRLSSEFLVSLPEITPEGLTLSGGPFPPLRFDVFPCENHKDFPKNQCTKWFDYDKIEDTLSVRYRRTGDYITLSGGGRKTLKSFLIDEKIPREQRDRIPLLAEGSHILWIAGLRISEYYKITEHTRMVLRVQLDGGTGSG